MYAVYWNQKQAETHCIQVISVAPRGAQEAEASQGKDLVR